MTSVEMNSNYENEQKLISRSIIINLKGNNDKSNRYGDENRVYTGCDTVDQKIYDLIW